MPRLLTVLLVALLLLAAVGCGGDGSNQTPGTPDRAPGDLTAEQIEHGIGPVRPFALEPVDAALAAQGEEIFTVKCSACHRMAERYVGPSLGDVTTRRSPAYIMNMILNPEEMVQRHPEARRLLAEYMAPMANQHLTEAEARAVLEFLRTQATP